jgi:hypothetical protein
MNFLTDEDLADLVEFKTDGDCDNTYRHSKTTMTRLAKLGVVRGRYETTAFGDYLIDVHFEQNIELPLNT